MAMLCWIFFIALLLLPALLLLLLLCFCWGSRLDPRLFCGGSGWIFE